MSDGGIQSRKGMNIYQRVQQVMQEVAYVRKDKAVENYMAVTHDMVTAVTRPSFVKAGIVMQPRVISAATIDTGRKSSKGNVAWRYEGRFEVDFVNIDEPTDRITICVDAHADDYGDKAPGKALSYATKSAVLKLLMLETGENDEGRIAPESPPLTDEEEKALLVLRAASLEGTVALQTAWTEVGKPMRQALANHILSLKQAAAKVDHPEAQDAA
jgi:hypothetical protein